MEELIQGLHGLISERNQIGAKMPCIPTWNKLSFSQSPATLMAHLYKKSELWVGVNKGVITAGADIDPSLDLYNSYFTCGEAMCPVMLPNFFGGWW